MGHTDLAMTRRYAELSQTDVKEPGDSGEIALRAEVVARLTRKGCRRLRVTTGAEITLGIVFSIFQRESRCLALNGERYLALPMARWQASGSAAR